MFERFLNHFPEVDTPDHLNDQYIDEYLAFLVRQGRSDSYLNQAVNAIKFYFEQVINMPGRFYRVDRPQKAEKLPEVISV